MLRSHSVKLAILLLVLIITLACRQSVQPLEIPTIVYNKPTTAQPATQTPDPTVSTYLLQVRSPGDLSITSPTPDTPRKLPQIRDEVDTYIVQLGDNLESIAVRYGITLQMLLEANQITNPDIIEVGQVLEIPAPIPGESGTGSKIIPDSELVYGPLAQSFNVTAFVSRFDSYLSRYSEGVEGKTLTGAEVVKQVALDYSVNPRLLLAILEYQSGWVTMANPPEDTLVFPIGIRDGWHASLYLQLAWAADMLNQGYYLWRVGGVAGWLLTTGEIVPADASINAGTAGVQNLFALLNDRSGWDQAVSAEGLYKTFSNFFGYPFDYAWEPLIPEDIAQPEMQLPFEPGVDWAFTGGPHGGWGSGSAWAALDFAPGFNGLGCLQSEVWVVAAADGLIIRSDGGRVIEDLDGDGNEGSGWSIMYMHIEGRDRVEAGTRVKAGDHIGHPSCEGGYSTGTHVHLARRYNGEWIPADRVQEENGLPFNLEGWVSSGNGIEYDGLLERDGETVAAWEGFYPENTIRR